MFAINPCLISKVHTKSTFFLKIDAFCTNSGRRVKFFLLKYNPSALNGTEGTCLWKKTASSLFLQLLHVLLPLSKNSTLSFYYPLTSWKPPFLFSIQFGIFFFEKNYLIFLTASKNNFFSFFRCLKKKTKKK